MKKRSTTIKLESDSFDSFLLKSHTDSVKDYGTSIIQGVIKFLDLCDIKNDSRRYTITSLLDFLTTKNVKDKEEFLCNVMKWTRQISKRSEKEDKLQIKETIYNYLTGTLLPLFGKNATESANEFFNVRVADDVAEQKLEQGNVY